MHSGVLAFEASGYLFSRETTTFGLIDWLVGISGMSACMTLRCIKDKLGMLDMEFMRTIKNELLNHPIECKTP